MKKQKVTSQINLERLAGGAFAEKLNEALMQVAENIQKPEHRSHHQETDQHSDKIRTEQEPSSNQYPDLRHDQARSYGGNRHSNGDGRQYQNRADRDRRV